jgi:predicted amidohydrolase YtcJ
MTAARRLKEFLLVVTVAAVCILGNSQRALAQGLRVEVADTIILHGRVYTLDPSKPWARAVAIHKDKIIAVGDDAQIGVMRGIGTKVIDAGGKLVLPGFVDCHIHFLEGSLSLDRVNLNGAKNPADIQRILREYAAKHPGDSLILGAGWNYAMFGDEKLPHKKYLDEVFPDRPVFLVGFDGHTSWANSKALALADITGDLPDPVNGVIVRDAKTGEATGALKEAATQLMERVVPKPTKDEKLKALRAGIRWANQNGLTRVHSAGGDFEEFDLYEELLRHNDLRLRMYIAYFLNPPELGPKDLDAIEEARKKYTSDWLSGGAVKMMLDGVVESHTAAMLEPYSDDPSTKGKLFWEPEKYKEAVAELDKRGFQLFTHAIGDYAVRTALDAYENAENVNHTKDRRPRIEHIETVTAADIQRFGSLGVMASMQPLHAYPDDDTLKVWAGNNGPDRSSRGFAWHSIAASGGRLAFGSDWNVVTLNPWEGLQMAVTRQTTERKPEGGWLPNERVTLEQAVEAYTLGAAYAGRREKTEGSIEPGKLADLIMVSQNIFEIEPHNIVKTKVMMTMVGGRVVYRAAQK